MCLFIRKRKRSGIIKDKELISLFRLVNACFRILFVVRIIQNIDVSHIRKTILENLTFILIVLKLFSLFIIWIRVIKQVLSSSLCFHPLIILVEYPSHGSHLTSNVIWVSIDGGKIIYDEIIILLSLCPDIFLFGLLRSRRMNKLALLFDKFNTIVLYLIFPWNLLSRKRIVLHTDFNSR